MKLIKLATQIIFLFYAIEASEYPQRKELPLFKVDDSVIDDIFVNSRINQYSGEQKVNNLHITVLLLLYLIFNPTSLWLMKKRQFKTRFTIFIMFNKEHTL